MTRRVDEGELRARYHEWRARVNSRKAEKTGSIVSKEKARYHKAHSFQAVGVRPPTRLGEDGAREPGPRYHLDHGGKTVGDEKGYLSPGLAGRALKALPGHDKMHVVRRDAGGKVVKRWDHAMRFLEAHTLDQLEKRRIHHGEEEMRHRDRADKHERRALRAITPSRSYDPQRVKGNPRSHEATHNDAADRHHHRADRHAQAWDAAARLIGRKKGIKEDDMRALTLKDILEGKSREKFKEKRRDGDKAEKRAKKRDVETVEEDIDVRISKLKSAIEKKSREGIGNGDTKDRERISHELRTLDGQLSSLHAKKKRKSEIDEDTPVGRVSMTRSGSAHAHGILAVARALHGKKVKVAHKDNFGRSVKSAADARHGDVSIRDDVLEVPLDMVSEIFGPHALEDLQHALDELHGKGSLLKIKKHHDAQISYHGRAGSDAEDHGDQEGWEHHYGKGVEHEQKYDRANALMRHRDSDRVTSRKTKRDLRAHNPHPKAFERGKAYEDLEIEEGRGRPRKQANVQGGDQQEDPDSHIVVHLRKAITLRGQHSVAFQHGGPAKVAPSDAHLALLRHDDMHPRHREEFARRLGHSHDSFRRAITH